MHELELEIDQSLFVLHPLSLAQSGRFVRWSSALFGRHTLVSTPVSLAKVVVLATLTACRPTVSAAPTSSSVDATAADAMIAAATAALTPDSGADVKPEEPARATGPFEVKFSGERNVYYAIPPRKGPKRLIAMLHGVCNPPGYACGYWWPAAVERGFLVCPEGNGRCSSACEDCRADRKDGPPSWEESFVDVDRDLEKSIAKVDGVYPGEIDRTEGAVLAGFSRGAYAAVIIARLHPNRWPFLILNEADTEVTAAQLRASGVRAVVLMAGGWGLNVGPERKTFEQLQKDGFRAKLILMPKAGHHYSENIVELMREALAFFDDADAG
jgi:pimeloyl-ACP methyl ester carboxylesterase